MSLPFQVMETESPCIVRITDQSKMTGLCMILTLKTECRLPRVRNIQEARVCQLLTRSALYQPAIKRAERKTYGVEVSGDIRIISRICQTVRILAIYLAWGPAYRHYACKVSEN